MSRPDYRRSRRFSSQPDSPALAYPGRILVARVTNTGTIRSNDGLRFTTRAREQHHIGLEEIDTRLWPIYLGSVLLVRLDERDNVIRD